MQEVTQQVEQERKTNIQRAVAQFRKMNENEDKIMALIMDIFELTEEESREYMR